MTLNEIKTQLYTKDSYVDKSHYLFIPPVLADLVDKDDVVRLSHGQLCPVRGELQSLDNVALLAVFGVGGLSAELVALFA